MTVDIPLALHTGLFLEFVKSEIKKFKATPGFGRWLVEYENMDKLGLFEPKAMRSQYIKILCGSYKYGFIFKEAIWYICSNALDSVNDYDEDSLFDIRLITSGEVGLDDDDEELSGLSLEEAVYMCLKLNKETGMKLYQVFDSDMDILIM